MDEDLCYLTIADAADLLARREISAVQLTRAFLTRIKRLDPLLNSYVTVMAERALDQAKRADALPPADRGALHGIPIGVKDMYDIAGFATTQGCDDLRGRIAATTAEAVRRVEAAGAIILGKHATHQFAVCGPSFDTGFPPVHNPWNLDYYSGGSSSGSASAVAAGLCMGALGSDAGGSIRKPASWCGIAGFKPSRGRVSTTGMAVVAPSLDHAGPMAWTARDAGLLLQALSGCVAAPATPVSLKGVAIGVPRHFYQDQADAAVVSAIDEALAVLANCGAAVSDAQAAPLADYNDVYSVIMAWESFHEHAHRLATGEIRYSAVVRERLLAGREVTDERYTAACERRRALAAEHATLHAKFDALAYPGDLSTAPRIDQLEQPMRPVMLLTTPVANLTGSPALSVCCGFDRRGLPISLQITAANGRDQTVVALAHAYESATGWRSRRPPVRA